MKEDSLLFAIKASLVALVAEVLDLYTGAFLIALAASSLRMVYGYNYCKGGDRCRLWCRIRLFLKTLIISAGLTMLMVHVGQMMMWSGSQTIVVSGVAAFMSKELIDIMILVVPVAIKTWINSKTGR